MSSGTIAITLDTSPACAITLDTSPAIPVSLVYTVVVTPAFIVDENADLYVNELGELYYG